MNSYITLVFMKNLITNKSKHKIQNMLHICIVLSPSQLVYDLYESVSLSLFLGVHLYSWCYIIIMIIISRGMINSLCFLLYIFYFFLFVLFIRVSCLIICTYSLPLTLSHIPISFVHIINY